MAASPLWISIKVAFTATMFTFFFGIIAAKLVAGMKRGKFLADALFSLPLVLPPTVIGFFLLILFGKNSALGLFLERLGISVIFTWQGAVIAAAAVSFPVMYRTARGAFEQVDPELIDAAKTMGFGRAGIFFEVWLPLAWPGIAAGTVLAFARALGEFGATIMIAGNLPGKTRTMSIAVYTAMQSGNREQAYQWVILILLISFAMLLCLNFWGNAQYKRE
ncbi:MAG: molybdate ABC transporter permease subunit [Lachnospiraceae bacterium]|nr:molybdate ABC transporter permease subunit [Lachnospiraceae bacterium]